MFIPYKVDVPMERWPIANWVLMGAIIVSSIVLFPALGEWRNDAHAAAYVQALSDQRVELPHPQGVLRYFLLFPGHWHPAQLLGHMFLHGDLFHLAGNMLFLFVFGNAVNAKLGHVKYVLLFLGIGALVGVSGLLLGNRPALGASGAIMGIVGAFLLLYPLNDVSVAYWFSWYWRGAFDISAGWVIATYVAFDVWGMVFKSHAGVGYLAHVVGFLLGAGILAALLWWKHIEMIRGEKSLLQAFGWMAHEEDDVEENRSKLNPLTGRPFAPTPTRATPGASPGTTATLAPPPRRVKRDDGPIPLD
jgi:membrane associated rhomboid family serine protease